MLWHLFGRLPNGLYLLNVTLEKHHMDRFKQLYDAFYPEATYEIYEGKLSNRDAAKYKTPLQFAHDYRSINFLHEVIAE